MTPIKEGDEVRVISGHPYRRTPPGGHRATVTNVARKYATAVYTIGLESHHERTIEFEIATGLERGSTGNYGTHVWTPEQIDSRDRLDAAKAVLKNAGFEVRLGHRPSGELIEALAEVAKTFGKDAQ
jgi:hypothetical protein